MVPVHSFTFFVSCPFKVQTLQYVLCKYPSWIGIYWVTHFDYTTPHRTTQHHTTPHHTTPLQKLFSMPCSLLSKAIPYLILPLQLTVAYLEATLKIVEQQRGKFPIFNQIFYLMILMRLRHRRRWTWSASQHNTKPGSEFQPLDDVEEVF